MAISNLITPASQNDVQNKVNEIVDNVGSAVLYTEQSLSVPQLAQAIHNLGGSGVGIWPVERGGTGSSYIDIARGNLGADLRGCWTIECGGTGAYDAAEARDNLGVAGIFTGTWTPSFRGYTKAGTVTSTITSATYVKIGGWYYCSCTFSVTSFSGMEGHLCLSGLPEVASVNGYIIVGAPIRIAGNFVYGVCGNVAVGKNYALLRNSAGTPMASSSLAVGDGGNGFSFIYVP